MDKSKSQSISPLELPLMQGLHSSRLASVDESQGRFLAAAGSPLPCAPLDVSVTQAAIRQPANPQAVFTAVTSILQSTWDFQQSLLHVLYRGREDTRAWLSLGASRKGELSRFLSGLFDMEGVAASIDENSPLPDSFHGLGHAAVVLGIPALKSGELGLRTSPTMEQLTRGLAERQFAIVTLARRCSRREVEQERLALLERLNAIAFAAEPVNITEEQNESGRQAREMQAKTATQKENTQSVTASLESTIGVEASAEFSIPLNPLGTTKVAAKATNSLKVGTSGTLGWKSAKITEDQVRASNEQATGQRLVLSAVRPPHPWAAELKTQLKADADRLTVPQCWDVAQIFLAQSEVDLRILVQRFRSQIPTLRHGYVVPLQSLHAKWLTHLPGINAESNDTPQDLALRLTYEELARLLCFPL